MSYKVWVDPEALTEAKAAPGNVRQRLKRLFKSFEDNPRPPESKRLDWPEDRFEPRRVRVGDWRVVYAFSDADGWVWVLAVRRRPPYDYGDLAELLASVRS